MEGLEPEQRELLAAYWWQRAEGELTSWVGFQHVVADLRAESSPRTIIALAERAVDDERQHTERCRMWAVRFGHAESELTTRGDKPIAFRGATDIQNRLLRITLCGMSETVGCFVLRHARPLISDPELREFNRHNMADEVRHSRVGWGHLATIPPAQRDFMRPWVAALLRLLHAGWCESGELEREDLVPFGYFSGRLLRAAYKEAVESVILPGMAHLGIGSAA
ncbi:MAG: ferritin-like domain-containing protein [Polyangiaceae bacterium]